MSGFRIREVPVSFTSINNLSRRDEVCRQLKPLLRDMNDRIRINEVIYVFPSSFKLLLLMTYVKKGMSNLHKNKHIFGSAYSLVNGYAHLAVDLGLAKIIPEGRSIRLSLTQKGKDLVKILLE